jgi:glycosyltransferase involved in cell wall biosynthesis
MKRKVVLIAETVMDGVGKHVVDLIDQLNKEKFEIHVLHGTSRTDYRFEDIVKKWSHEVHFYQIESLKREIELSKDFKAFGEIRKAIKSINPELVHCHSSKAGVVGRLAAKTCGVKKVFYTPHAYAMQSQDHWTPKRRFYWLIERFLARFATTSTINVSKGERQFAIDLGIEKPEHFLVVYNALDHNGNADPIENLRETLGIGAEHFVVGCVARLYYQKNPFEFLRVAKALCLLREDLHFVWVGTGEMMVDARIWCKDNGILDRFHFVGHQKNVDAYLNIFDVFLATSYYEGLPYTLVEAMRAGCPIVATDVVGNNEVVVNGENGFLYKLGGINEAANKILRLKEDDALRTEMKENSKSRFEELFAIENMIKKIESIYEK